MLLLSAATHVATADQDVVGEVTEATTSLL